MRRFWLPVALLLALVIAGCGITKNAPTVPTPVTVQGVEYIPKSAIAVPLESSRTPENAKGAYRTRFYNPPEEGEVHVPPTLTGSAIRIDATGAKLIEGFENVYEARYCPYWDPFGHVWTRGFGETDFSGNFGGRCISHAQAEANVRYLVEAQYQYAVRSLGMNLSQRQVDALDDLVWNLGPGVLTPGGSLRFAMQHHEWSAILAYDRAGGVVLSGLAARRRDEYNLLRFSPPPPPETAAQKRARERRELAGHKQELQKLRVRIKVLRRELLVKGCDARVKKREPTGPICKRWRREGNEDGAHGRFEDAEIKRLERALR